MSHDRLKAMDVSSGDAKSGYEGAMAMFVIARHVDCFPGKSLRFLRGQSLIEVTGRDVPEVVAAVTKGTSDKRTTMLMKPLVAQGAVVEVPESKDRSSLRFPAELSRGFASDSYPSGLWAMRVFRLVYLLDWSAAFWADAGGRFLECLLGSQRNRTQFLAASMLWHGPATIATQFFSEREEQWLMRQRERWQARSRSPSVAVLDPIARSVIASYTVTDPWDAAALFRPGGPCLSGGRRKFSRGARPFHVAFVNSGVTTAGALTDWPYYVTSGRSEDSKDAGIKASAEAFERWVNGFVVPSRLAKASLEEIGPAAIHPRRVVAYAEWQYRRKSFPFHRFDKRRSVHWVKGHSMVGGSERYVLAEEIFYPFPYTTKPYTSANSSGAAAHRTKPMAEDFALAELVERDAFMAHWLLRKSPHLIEPMSLPAELQSIVRECRQRKWEVKLFDMTLESGVVILALGANRDTRHGWILGSACSWHDPLAAARHALDEVKLAVLFHRPEPRPKRSVPREVRSLWDHQRLYCNPVIQKKASFLFEGSHVRFTDLAPKGDAASLRKRLPLSAESPISVDLTDQLPFAPPYAAVKVIVPGLIPLTFGYCREPFGMPRLTSLARSFRLQRTARPATPHPFT